MKLAATQIPLGQIILLQRGSTCCKHKAQRVQVMTQKRPHRTFLLSGFIKQVNAAMVSTHSLMT